MARENLAFVAYETRFAPCGGIAAVMNYLPQAVKEQSGQRTVIITPWHDRLPRRAPPASALRHAGSCEVPFGARRVGFDILHHATPDGFDWHLLKPRQDGVPGEPAFHGAPDPYRVAGEAILVRDSLLFGKAVIAALPHVAPGPWVLFLQDWETATAALAAACDPPAMPVRHVLTLHNGYDNGLDDATLREHGFDPARCRGWGEPEIRTVLGRALPLVAHRVFTVSAQFAADLHDDVLQTQVIAPHLAAPLRNRLLGVDNGPFERSLDAKIAAARPPELDALLLKREAIARARGGDADALIAWKQTRRDAFLQVIATHTFHDAPVPPPDLAIDGFAPLWGDRARFIARSQSGSPWFITGGRDDPRQRGHDVALAAARRFLDQGGDALFLFMVTPGVEGYAGLRFLHDACAASDGRIIALPFHFQAGFLAALEAAAFGLFPSLYEPFGGANEFYLQGTVGIARATGGLLQQIVPLRAAACCGHAVNRRAQAWHSFSAPPTGLLYREQDGPDRAAAWQAINHAGYQQPGAPDRVAQRLAIPLFASMVDELHAALRDAARILQTPALYVGMLLNGMDHIARTFSWPRTAQEYIRVIQP